MSPRNWAVSGQQSTHAISEGAEVCRSYITVAVGFGINRPSSLLLGRRSERSGSHSSYSRTVLTAFGACCFILVFARQSQRDRRSILLICITELVQAALTGVMLFMMSNKGSVRFVLKFALPPLSPPLPSVVQFPTPQ